MVTRTAFGALPIQRCSEADAVAILRRALEAGVNFYDTARAYSDSEAKIGKAFSPAERQAIVISTKTFAETAAELWEHLHTSLKNLNTDYVDIYQFHNPASVPMPGGAGGLYEAALEAKKQGKIRFIGITNHRIEIAKQAVASGLFDTLQYPFSLLSGPLEFELAEMCRESDTGFIAMKALSGGLLTNAAAAFAFMRQYEHVVPIWGIQRMSELEQFIALEADPPELDAAMLAQIEKECGALQGDFCRGCGYCLPCPAGIEINMAARIYYFITRSPYKNFITPEYQAHMAKVEDCINCGACKSRCPYGLDTPELLKRQYELYKGFVREHDGEI